MKKLFWIVLIALVIAMLLPVRPAMRAPRVERFTPAYLSDQKSASLARVLSLTEEKPLLAVSVFCYGLPTDRLAASLGSDEPTRATFYFDGTKYIGATATYQGADEYFDLQGRSAEQLDGMTYAQWCEAQE